MQRLCLFLILVLAACGKLQEQAELDDQKIQDYLDGVSWYAQAHHSGFYYSFIEVDTSCGGGCEVNFMCSNQCGDGCLRPCTYSIVEFNYQVFDLDSLAMGDTTPVLSAMDTTIFETVENMVPGLQLALTELEDFTLGASAYLLLPSRLAYKESGWNGQIKPNASLLLYVKLVESHPHF